MFFTLSKVLWFFVQPLHLITLLGIAAAAMAGLRRRRAAIALAVVALLLVLLVGFVPIPAAALRVLEDRFPPPELGDVEPDGIIVVGGAIIAGRLPLERATVTLNAQAERMTSALVLARRYPQVPVVYTGGSGALFPDGLSEAEVARRFFEEQGLDLQRLVLEGGSRNTYENAVNSSKLVDPAPDSRWIILTSAFHMPRTVGVFRAQGWNVIPYPVDYLTSSSSPRAAFDLHDGADLSWYALHEWLGLIAYRLTGKTARLLPGPLPTDGH
jgi:uncharacterized SAM-binding protein YcdF (DUF218 family)